MPNYSVTDLQKRGPAVAFALLRQCIDNKTNYITYGRLAEELEYQLGIDKVFSIHPGKVAGALMDRILEIDPKAPLINVLIARTGGLPGEGVGPYIDNATRNRLKQPWATLDKQGKRDWLNKEYELILRYKKWDELLKVILEGAEKPIIRTPNPQETDAYKHTGKGESQEHKALKQFVAQNPKAIGLKAFTVEGDPEFNLFSGDSIDVLFSQEMKYVAVEVKSCRSNDEDHKRGVYQCVKYRSVLDAQLEETGSKVSAILVTERPLNADLKARARRLKIKTIVLNINRHCKSGKC